MKKSKATKSDSNTRSTAPEIEIEERIRHRAYELWERSGNIHGRDLEHWLQARAEIMGTDSDKKVPE